MDRQLPGRRCNPRLGAEGFVDVPDCAVFADLLDGSNVPIGDSQLLIRRGELQPVPNCEISFNFAVGGDAAQPRGIIGDLLSTRILDRQEILFRIGCNHLGVAARLDADGNAAALVMD